MGFCPKIASPLTCASATRNVSTDFEVSTAFRFWVRIPYMGETDRRTDGRAAIRNGVPPNNEHAYTKTPVVYSRVDNTDAVIACK